MLALVGPTGIGKTEAAMEIARRVPSEIVVVDSMQVYRHMEIGTGKPPRWMREEVAHHGLDLAEPEEEFDVARYVREVRPAIQKILDRGRHVLLVGGAGLYFRGLIDGLCEAPPRDPALRERLAARAKEEGAAALHAELSRVDQEAASRVHPNDLRRITRALEVYRLTGKPISAWQRETTEPFHAAEQAPHLCIGAGQVCWVGLVEERGSLYRRIEARVDRWLNEGWMDEARALAARGLSRTARECLGYAELFSCLRGEHSLEEARRLIQRNTRRYAKRQWAWFRADPRVRWVEVDHLSPRQVAGRILGEWGDRE